MRFLEGGTCEEYLPISINLDDSCTYIVKPTYRFKADDSGMPKKDEALDTTSSLGESALTPTPGYSILK